MAISKSRRKKLEMLTRSLGRRDIAAAEELLRTRRRARARRRPVALKAVAPGRSIRAGGARYWLVRRRLADLADEPVEVQRDYAAVVRGAGQRLDELRASAALCRIADGTPEGPLFLDIETCGLVGACVFLIGLMSYRSGELIFEQLLARHYGEERAIMAAFARRLGSAETLVTFNGKAFDMTNLRERAVFHGVRIPDCPPHCDLLHESRRRWRHQLPNCRLQTLERYLCRRSRIGDIPSHQIPQVYHTFVANGDAAAIKAVLHHNLLDLLTMAQLLAAVLAGRGADVDF